MIQAGIRGSLYGADDERIPDELGVKTIPWMELSALSPGEFAARVTARVGDGPTLVSFDVDLVDCAFCPGTGTREVAGPTSFQAMAYLRALADVPFAGYDVVEVAPQYDGPGQPTALFAANAMFDAHDGGTAQARRRCGAVAVAPAGTLARSARRGPVLHVDSALYTLERTLDEPWERERCTHEPGCSSPRSGSDRPDAG